MVHKKKAKMKFVLLTSLLLVFAISVQARYRHPFALDGVRTYFPSEVDQSGFNEEPSAAFLTTNENVPDYESRRRASMIIPSEKNSETEEIKKNDPVLSPLNEVEREAARMDEFGPTNAQLYGDYYNYSIKKKMRKTQALNRLYEEIAAKFPFLVKQGLFETGSPPSLDHLLSMTVFSQPKMGRK